ncbi:MAG: hypothetical protein RLZZ342_323 [Candidatus Parcubacteria bacterium]|jgi:hypothetical protein
MHPLRSQKGFTLLLAALVSTIVLALGAAIYGLVVKELALSSLGRDSQFAFFAADTGAECALYWDIRHNYFDTVAPVGVVAPDPRCAEQSFVATGRSTSYPYTMAFQIDAGGYCTNVSVMKCDGPITTDGTCSPVVPAQIHTLIHADGYSASCATLTTKARVLQRSVELRY